ncbi:MAG: carboxypeptidase regulatory-like domain-containing protein, partial [Pirellulales bacterium]|nr:carboxypeptidase regulatory-like domain-containing protein [Pirellulales bacterium]
MKRRSSRPERLEMRRLFAADPIHVGVVYIETDYLETDQDVGSDSRGDRFILSFTGGAPDTELSELRIRTDKDGDGISVGDPIFDTAIGGRGKGGAHDFQILRVETSDGRQIHVTAEVEDGGQELVLRLSNFRSGDRLEFSLDVDEVLRNAIDLDVFNDRLDVITSGQEFQDSILEATFNAPHFETSHADAVFVNDFGDPASALGLNLPPDEGDDPFSRPNRSAAAVGSAMQVPEPVEISGNVWLDNNLNSVREAGEAPLADVDIALWRWQPDLNRYVDTGLRASTDGQGRYVFPASLGILPGTYRLVESQPDGVFSVASLTGEVEGQPSGQAESVDVLTEIAIPLGGTSAVNFDFAEAQSASLSGFVYQDDNNDGVRDPSETGIAGVQVRLVPLDTIAPQASLTAITDANGAYRFSGLAPGSYEVIEVNQPADLSDGKDSPGTIAGQVVGVADNPGDRITAISLAGNDVAVEYNFGEVPFGSLTGFVYLAAPGEDCNSHHDTDGSTPLVDVSLELQSSDGTTIATTRTGADGSYRFGRLPVGNYRIVQFTPDGLIDGSAHTGTIDGLPVGSALGGGLIQDITLTAGGLGVEYNFCEAAPANISGYVFEDQSNDGIRDVGEVGIEQTRIALVDSVGNIVATTQTDQNGRYEFTGIAPGQYSLVETQPAGFLDGLDSVGRIRGNSVGQTGPGSDTLSLITLKQGDQGVEYNFGELRAASLSGRVHADLDDDCVLDPGEQTLAAVVIRLLDESGNEVARTSTNNNGEYSFSSIAPGTYTIIEEQPDGFLEGSATPGNAGGDAQGANRVANIVLAPGEVAVDYDFCERPPAQIIGNVFADADGDCLFEPGDTGIGGVTIELYDSAGALIASTQTDAAGNYQFSNLPAGQYTIREIQPPGWLQGGQRAGSRGGDDSAPDVISQIPVGWGQRLTQYNFCELAPASVSGMVWQESNPNQQFDPADQPVPGVLVELIDQGGEVIAQTTTNSDGKYLFEGIAPGVYSVRQTQPAGLFHGGQVV